MAAARVLYVVSRDRPDIYASLRATFIESLRLQIVLDRRGAVSQTPRPERRHLLVEQSLRTQGWARIRIEPDGHAVVADPALPPESFSSPSY